MLDTRVRDYSLIAVHKIPNLRVCSYQRRSYRRINDTGSQNVSSLRDAEIILRAGQRIISEINILIENSQGSSQIPKSNPQLLNAEIKKKIARHENIKLNNRFITHPQLQADMFADYFASKNAYHEPLLLDFLYDKNNLLNKPFHILELHSAIKNSKNTTPGADHVTAIFFKNLDQGQRDVILRYFQKLFDNAIVPDSWKHAIILPIPKPCKDKTKISSYIPIALTSVFSKTFERILTNRISYYLTKRKLHPQHYSFVPFKDSRSATYLVHKAIMNAKLQKFFLVGISLDIKSAYDSVYVDGLIYTCLQIETLAICQALDDLVESNVNLLVLSDSLSVLSALQNFSIKSHKVIHRLANKIYMLSNYVNQLILLWTPGHSKIVWNEQADNLARSVTESNVYIDWIASEDIHKNIYRNRIKKNQ
ncbi:uncharacterized protein TNCV_928711 [Trichonephila clavipes]|nr:uncharacterized protein TNCV_928711 [Trichonephila clavipes]